MKKLKNVFLLAAMAVSAVCATATFTSCGNDQPDSSVTSPSSITITGLQSIHNGKEFTVQIKTAASDETSLATGSGTVGSGNLNQLWSNLYSGGALWTASGSYDVILTVTLNNNVPGVYTSKAKVAFSNGGATIGFDKFQ